MAEEKIEVRYLYTGIHMFGFLITCFLCACTLGTNNTQADDNDHLSHMDVEITQPLLSQRLFRAKEYYEKGLINDDSIKRIQKNMYVQEKIMGTSSFKGIFRMARRNSKMEVVLIDDVLTHYTESCCKDVAAVTELLEANGFKNITLKTRKDNPEFFEKKKHQLYIQADETEYVFGYKKKTFGWFPDTWVARFHFRNGQFKRAAGAVKASPPL